MAAGSKISRSRSAAVAQRRKDRLGSSSSSSSHHHPLAAPTSALPLQTSTSAFCRAQRQLQRRSTRCLPAACECSDPSAGRWEDGLGLTGPLGEAGHVPSSGFSSGTPRHAGICPDFRCHLQFPGREKDQKLTLQNGQHPGGLWLTAP